MSTLTLPQLVYNLRNIIRDNRSDDIKVTDRQLEFIINYYRARLIKQEVDKNRPVSSNIIQDLGKVPLTKMDMSEISGVVTGDNILRTTDEIPKLLELNQKDAIIYIGGLDKVSNIDFVTKAQSKWNRYNKYGSKLPTAYYRNGYIYIINFPKNTKFINIEGIFVDPREVSRYKTDGIMCYDITQDPYPMSEYMISTLTDMVVSKELTVFLQMTPDEVNDASDEIKNSTQAVPFKTRQEQQLKGKNKIQNVLTLKHSYQYYIKDIAETSKYRVEYNLYRSICEEANKLLSSLIVDEGLFLNVPYRLGNIRIKKRKINFKNLKPNFGLYNESEGEIKNKHLNEHSGGYYCMFYWNKKACVVKNKSAYSFIPTRYNKRYLASQLKLRGKELINSYFE